jgi:hypothetical protein
MNRHPKSRGIQDWSQSKSETEFLPTSFRSGATFFPPFALAPAGARALQPDFELVGGAIALSRLLDPVPFGRFKITSSYCPGAQAAAPSKLYFGKRSLVSTKLPQT